MAVTSVCHCVAVMDPNQRNAALFLHFTKSIVSEKPLLQEWDIAKYKIQVLHIGYNLEQYTQIFSYLHTHIHTLYVCEDQNQS